MKITASKEEIAPIVKNVAFHFRTFGGGNVNKYNPISIALADKPPCFAAGVNVQEVVEFVMRELGYEIY